MIDLLGHGGHFEDVENLMRNMPFDPGAIGWVALLDTYRSHGNVKAEESCSRTPFEIGAIKHHV